ncbi:MAG TPA: hypothetical protein VKB81_00900 [Nitrospira sp.]|nr:hypothetical protein [Nitrospira sp.]
MQSHINHTRRQLTYDERKAAEAAFQGYAFHEDWSEAARAVYEGIVTAKMKLTSRTRCETATMEEGAPGRARTGLALSDECSRDPGYRRGATINQF